MKNKHWYDYLWIWTICYFILGSVNILFAWLGMIDFMVPLFTALLGGSKAFCNRYCGRSQLLNKLGSKCSRYSPTPRWLCSKWFRFGFQVFFLINFIDVVYRTCLVAAGAMELERTVELLWLIPVPWHWAYIPSFVPDWVAQFSFGFFGLMLTSTIVGLVVMVLFKPRSWCAFCPMGTMTQTICKLKHREKL